MAWGRKKKDVAAAAGADGEQSFGYEAIVTLIRTRMDPPASFEAMQAVGVHPQLAVRYLDLAVAVAARELLGKMSGQVELPETYIPTAEIPALSSTFADCAISAELTSVYQAEPTAASLIGPLAPDFVAINQAMQSGQQGPLRLTPPTIGDGSQVGFARATFGDQAILDLAKEWPDLA